MSALAAGQRTWSRYGRGAALLLAAILALKLALLFWLGPSFFPDSHGYIAPADGLLAGHWLDQLDWRSVPTPLAIQRPFGYPLLVALAKLAAGRDFGLALASLQCVASVAALGLVAAALAALIERPALRYAVLVLAALSGSALYDIVVLSDSIYASLFIVAVFAIAMDMTGQLRLGAGALAALGAAWGLSIWVRDVGVYFTLFPLIGLVMAGRVSGLRMAAILGSLVLFLAPAAALVALHMLWNLERTGLFVLSVGSDSINWLWPSANIAAMGLADPFDGGDFVSRVARSHALAAGLAGVFQLVDMLRRDYGLDPQQLDRVLFGHFTSVLARHPLAYLATIPHNLQIVRLAELLLDPLANFNDFLQLGPTASARVVPGMHELREMQREGLALNAAGLAPLLLALDVAALLGLAVIALATPIAALRRCRGGSCRRHAAAAFLWLTFMGLVGAYALLHLEMRYALPVIPAALACLGYCFDGWWPRRHAPASQS